MDNLSKYFDCACANDSISNSFRLPNTTLLGNLLQKINQISKKLKQIPELKQVQSILKEMWTTLVNIF